MERNLFSPRYSWKIANLVLNQNIWPMDILVVDEIFMCSSLQE